MAGFRHPVHPLRKGKLEDWQSITERKWEVGKSSQIYTLLPQSQGDANTKFEENIPFLWDLGNGAANFEIREEICRVNEDQLYLSSA